MAWTALVAQVQVQERVPAEQRQAALVEVPAQVLEQVLVPGQARALGLEPVRVLAPAAWAQAPGRPGAVVPAQVQAGAVRP